MIELYKKKVSINNTLINKKNQKALDYGMIWDSLLFVDQNRNGGKYLKHYFKV